jgi:hypothetical protein
VSAYLVMGLSQRLRLQHHGVAKEAINAAWAQVENQLQRRNDLIPNLVETTKGTPMKEIFENVANARAKR